MKVEVGDKIRIGNMTITIAELISQNYFDIDGWYIEFISTAGKYGYWKQACDGGKLIKKEDKQ